MQHVKKPGKVHVRPGCRMILRALWDGHVVLGIDEEDSKKSVADCLAWQIGPASPAAALQLE